MLKRINPRAARASAVAGAVVWAIALFIHTSQSNEIELIGKVLWLGVLVVVPLGLSVIARREPRESSALYGLAVITQPFGAVAVLASFLLQPGVAAALLAAAWLVVTSLIALDGLWRLWLNTNGRARTFEEVSISVGLVYVAVGGGWLILSRLGMQPLGFGDTIVLLTAVHFHFAGFAAPILVGLAGRRLINASRGTRRLFALIAIAVTTGTPLVAAGITVSPALALVGTLVISLGLASLAVLVLVRIVPVLASTPARLLLGLASVSSLVAMVLACLYAYSIVTKTLIVDIPQMAMSHGILNAFGFSLCGLLAWAIERSE